MGDILNDLYIFYRKRYKFEGRSPYTRVLEHREKQVNWKCHGIFRFSMENM